MTNKIEAGADLVRTIITNIKQRIAGRDKDIRTGRGEEIVIMSISASTQIPDRKPADKTEISREQHSKEANIKKVEVAKSYTKNDGLPNGFQNARYIHK